MGLSSARANHVWLSVLIVDLLSAAVPAIDESLVRSSAALLGLLVRPPLTSAGSLNSLIDGHLGDSIVVTLVVIVIIIFLLLLISVCVANKSHSVVDVGVWAVVNSHDTTVIVEPVVIGVDTDDKRSVLESANHLVHIIREEIVVSYPGHHIRGSIKGAGSVCSSGSGEVWIVGVCHGTICLLVPEDFVHPASIAAPGAVLTIDIVVSTVDDLLLGEPGHLAVATSDGDHALKHGVGGKGVAGTAPALVLDWSDQLVGGPVDASSLEGAGGALVLHAWSRSSDLAFDSVHILLHGSKDLLLFQLGLV